MTIHPTAELLFCIVEVDAPQVFEPDHILKLLECGFVTAFRFEVITGGVGVTGVQTDPYPALVLHVIYSERKNFISGVEAASAGVNPFLSLRKILAPFDNK